VYYNGSRHLSSVRRNDPGRNEPGDPAVLREARDEKPSGPVAGRCKRDGAGESTGAPGRGARFPERSLRGYSDR